MAKTKIKTAFFCQNCGAQYPKWVGKCTSCNEWNTIIEEVINKPNPNDVHASFSSKKGSKPQQIKNIEVINFPRIKLPGTELNRVLGGGLVSGSLVLFGGDPGIGKSTLMLQMSLRLKGYKIL